MPLKLKNGAILFSGEPGRLSQDCRCCERPTDCSLCCTGGVQLGDALNVTALLSLPGLSFDLSVFNFTTNSFESRGKRFVGGVTIGVTRNIFVSALERFIGPGTRSCFVAEEESSYQYSAFTFFRSDNLWYGIPKVGEAVIGGSALDASDSNNIACYFWFSALFTTWVSSIEAQTTGNIFLPLATSAPVGSWPFQYSLYGEASYANRGPCAGDSLSVSVSVTAVRTQQLFGAPIKVENISFSSGSIGTITANGVG